MEKKKVILWIVGILVFMFFMVGLFQIVFTMDTKEITLDSYSCDEINTALLTGNCLSIGDEVARFFYFFEVNMQSGCYSMNDLFVNYKFRCEDRIQPEEVQER